MMTSSTKYIMEQISIKPKIAIVLGSGLSELSSLMEDAVEIPYSQIPEFLHTTVAGHQGKMFFGKLLGKECVILAGRFHYYEGYKANEITGYIRVLKELGIEKLLLTNAAGGINKDFIPGDLMVIEDHINYANVNPLIGPNDDSIGPRFFDMSDAYSKEMRDIIHEAAANSGILIKSGVYVMFSGPNFETPAEIRMFSMMGADAVGMSTVPEVIAANHCGIKVAGISCITNLAAGISEQKLNHEEVIETGHRVKDKFKTLILNIMELL
jgi:purine-nucleoside phosphorylase